MLGREQAIKKLQALRPDLERRGVKHAYLIGSVARDEARPDSDVDVVVDLDRRLGYEFFSLQDFLTNAMNAPVELLTFAGLRPRVREQAERDIVVAF